MMYAEIERLRLAVETEIMALRARVAELEAALHDIVDNCLDNCECSGAYKARAALAKEGK